LSQRRGRVHVEDHPRGRTRRLYVVHDEALTGPGVFCHHLNTAAHLISKWRFKGITPLLRDLHWLREPQRVEYKLSVLVYRCLHNLAPEYLCDELRRVADISSMQRLRSSSTSALIVPPTQLSTVGDRAFPTAASRIWNSPPLHVTPAPSLYRLLRRG